MSRYTRTKRNRTGAPYFDGANGTLPRAQERVQKATEAISIIRGGWGVESPISASSGDLDDWYGGRGPFKESRVWYGPAARRYSEAERRSPRKGGFRLLGQLPVRYPQKVKFCAQRGVRREVLFAFRVAGRRGSSPGRGGRYRRTQNSQWRC